jgi:hypothetical protein
VRRAATFFSAFGVFADARTFAFGAGFRTITGTWDWVLGRPPQSRALAAPIANSASTARTMAGYRTGRMILHQGKHKIKG